MELNWNMFYELLNDYPKEDVGNLCAALDALIRGTPLDKQELVTQFLMQRTAFMVLFGFPIKEITEVLEQVYLDLLVEHRVN